MKSIALFAFLALCSCAVAVEKDRTITKVVKLLQDMLDKSVKEGDEERKIYAKFKCYCDQSEAEKTASVEDLTEKISLLESKIEETQGSTGELSSDCADLKAKMAANVAAREQADNLRKKEKKAFLDTKADLEQAIGQMKRAIETLTKVGADQTKSTGADNKQFMAKSLLSLETDVQHALRAASAFMNSEQQRTATAFLQAPFTGTYTSQSAVVMGIIKNMRDTFDKNLKDAIVTEGDSQDAHDEFMELKKKEHKVMSDSYDEKQKALGGNDGNLAAKRGQLADAEKQKASDEEFLDKLLPLCEEKAKGYANRKTLRANEEAAIAEAISILNSDDAFATFGGTSAGTTGFIQLRAVSKHMTGSMNVRRMAQNLLQKALKDTKSTRLSKVLASLQAENPFTGVLAEIDKMIDLIKEESKADKKNLDWCNSERKTNDQDLASRKKEITALEQLVDDLTSTIEDPKTGLKKQIEETETSLDSNRQSMKEETSERTEANLAYQANVKNLVQAESILNKAIKVLEAYYDDLEQKLAAGEAFVQKKEDPNPGEAWKGDGAYKGQSSKGGDVIKQLQFILDETVNEENRAHSDEENDQAKYEDFMAELKKQEASNEKNLSKLQKTLAEKEKALLDAQEDLKNTIADKESIEAYLEKIKPGCDFITKNFSLREKNRGIEKDALNKAIGLIKATPAFKTAVNEATVESYGDCKKPCTKNENDVKCKACMADVTIPAYCAGHKGTPGC